MKPILTSFLILASSLVAQARLIRHWSDQELLEKSDLVVIATPTTSADTRERTDLPGFSAQHVIGVETGFAVSAVVKGDKELKNFVLHHYRDDKVMDKVIVYGGPNLVAFKPEEKRKFLLFLIREADGRYSPTVGQGDPGMQGIAALGDPVTSTPNPSPLADEAKPTHHLVQTQMLDSGPDNKTALTVYVVVMTDGTRPKVFKAFDSKEMELWLSSLPRESVVRYDANGFLPSVEAAKLEALKTSCQKNGVHFLVGNVN